MGAYPQKLVGLFKYMLFIHILSKNTFIEYLVLFGSSTFLLHIHICTLIILMLPLLNILISHINFGCY